MSCKCFATLGIKLCSLHRSQYIVLRSINLPILSHLTLRMIMGILKDCIEQSPPQDPSRALVTPRLRILGTS